MWKVMIISATLGVASLSGCTHMQLRWNTTHQATTLTEIYEQQVLDNLARFVCDPESMPSFAYANGGSAYVSDSGNVGSQTVWNARGFASEVLTLGAARSMREAWTLTPVSDVRRLELMRCAYQWSVASAGMCPQGSSCPDCDRLMRTFYLGGPGEDFRSVEDREAGRPDTLATWTARTGRTTPACFQYVPWLCCGDKKSVPKDCCVKKGHYCGTCVWVAPGGQDELTKLTLVILDYAISPQAVRTPTPTMQVVWYFDENGNPVVPSGAKQQIIATVPYDKVRLGSARTKPLTQGSTKDEREAFDRKMFEEPFENLPRSYVPPLRRDATPFDPLRFQMFQDTLAPQPSQ